MFYASSAFANKAFLGVGPYAEWTLLSYHQKPFRKPSYFGLDDKTDYLPPSSTISAFVFAEVQLFNGLTDSGFSDTNRFITGNIGVGIRTTIPSFEKRRREVSAEERKELLEATAPE